MPGASLSTVAARSAAVRRSTTWLIPSAVISLSSAVVRLLRLPDRYKIPILIHCPELVRTPPTSRKFGASTRCKERSAITSGVPCAGVRVKYRRGSAAASDVTTMEPLSPPWPTRWVVAGVEHAAAGVDGHRAGRGRCRPRDVVRAARLLRHVGGGERDDPARFVSAGGGSEQADSSQGDGGQSGGRGQCGEESVRAEGVLHGPRTVTRRIGPVGSGSLNSRKYEP